PKTHQFPTFAQPPTTPPAATVDIVHAVTTAANVSTPHTNASHDTSTWNIREPPSATSTWNHSHQHMPPVVTSTCNQQPQQHMEPHSSLLTREGWMPWLPW